jgi:MFS family permease
MANAVRPLVAAATAPWHVLVVRVLDRVGKGIRTAPRDALLADSTPPEQRGRAFGFHRSMDHLGAVVGPLIASAIFAVGGRSYRLLFLLASLPGLLTIAFTAATIRELDARSRRRTENRAETANRACPAPPRTAPPPVSFRELDRRFFGLLLAVLVFALGNSSDAFLLLRLQQAGIDVVVLPFLWSALHAVKVASAYPFGRLSDRIGRLPVIVGGWCYYAAIYGVFAAGSSPATLAVAFVAYGFFYGLTEGAERALVGDLVGPERRGAAFGLYNAAVGLTALPASVIMGAIWEARGQAAAFAFGAAMAAVAGILLCAAGRAGGGRSGRRR